jgi:hypothetical protein
MATEADVWRTAFIIAEQYGPGGAGFAAQMAHSFRIGGKMDAHKVWVSIMERVEALTAPEKPDGITVQ